MSAEVDTARASQGNVSQLQLSAESAAEGQQVGAMVVPAKAQPGARAEARRHGPATALFDDTPEIALPWVRGKRGQTQNVYKEFTVCFDVQNWPDDRNKTKQAETYEAGGKAPLFQLQW